MNYRYYSAGGSVPNPDTSLNSNPLTHYAYHYDSNITCGAAFTEGHTTWDATGSVRSNCMSFNTGAHVVGRALTATTFSIAASANIGGSANDQWLVNQRKEFINVTNGAF